ncbi:MAG: PAS domain S-box protein [Actinobacteria bacterium]|nr:response regulator [Actinomycetota bacterium]NIW28505.1 PAS domain S-box protein [Actinomycetota bacterium]NIX20988.1 PAS domain S-box protein [Actinomycetota bacterium]
MRADFPNLPLVLVTGEGSEEVAERAFRIGVTDYYRKGTGLEQFRLLHNRLERYIEAARDRDRLAVVEGELDYWKEFAPAAVVVGPEGRIAAASVTSREVFGADELDELLGLDVWELVAPEEREEIREVIERVRREEADVVCRDRTLRDLEGGTTTTTVQWRPVEYWGEEALLAVMNDFEADGSGLAATS